MSGGDSNDARAPASAPASARVALVLLAGLAVGLAAGQLLMRAAHAAFS